MPPSISIKVFKASFHGTSVGLPILLGKMHSYYLLMDLPQFWGGCAQLDGSSAALTWPCAGTTVIVTRWPHSQSGALEGTAWRAGTSLSPHVVSSCDLGFFMWGLYSHKCKTATFSGGLDPYRRMDPIKLLLLLYSIWLKWVTGPPLVGLNVWHGCEREGDGKNASSWPLLD